VRAVAVVAFIRLYFDAGRLWLMWTIIATRSIVLIASFLVDPNFNFARIDSIDRIPFLGEQVTVVGQAVVSPHQWFATLSTYLVLAFVADASITLWRRGTQDARRKVIVIGGAVFLAWFVVATITQLTVYGYLHLPVLLAPASLIVLAAMTFELSRDTLRASRLAQELRASETQLQFAASAAGFGLWIWDADKRQVWATRTAREIFDLEDHEPVEIERLQRMVHPDDVESIRSVLVDATASGDERALQFRISRRDDSVRWIAVRGRSEADGRGKVSLIRGVLRDVTEQIGTQKEIEELHRELAHAGRVSLLGTLSSSLAHELSHPLGAIRFNATAAQTLLSQPTLDLAELRQILADIYHENQRAVDVIDRLRSLLKRRQLDFEPVSVEDLLEETSVLLKSDANARNVTLEFANDANLPMVQGDTVHLSQVLINLIINAMDAVADMPADRRLVSVRASAADQGRVEIAISDSGGGIPADGLERIFEPFYTTKDNGIGMGLSIARSIVETHGGRLWAENGEDGGAIFRVRLPVFE
jgi:C4-dicarboxylate-specific signal transduction histidine kinase